MSPRVRTMLAGRKRKTPWVFCAVASNKHPQGTQQISERRLLRSLKRLLKRIGLPEAGKLHTFRHSFISKALAEGITSATVRSWVGHVSDDILAEDIDLVQTQPEPIGSIIDGVRDAVSWLGHVAAIAGNDFSTNRTHGTSVAHRSGPSQSLRPGHPPSGMLPSVFFRLMKQRTRGFLSSFPPWRGAFPAVRNSSFPASRPRSDGERGNPLSRRPGDEAACGSR